MQNNSDNQGTGAKPNSLGNDEILEFAEEVLGAAKKEEIINLEDAQALGEDDDEEIIDLTDVADEASKEDTDEVVDLTEIADDLHTPDDGIVELDNISESGSEAESDDDIMELEDVINAFEGQEDDLVDLEEIAVEPDGEDDDFLTAEDNDDFDMQAAIGDQNDGQSFLDEDEIDLDDLDDLDELVPEEDDMPDLESDPEVIDLDDASVIDMPGSQEQAEAPDPIVTDQSNDPFNDLMASQSESDESSAEQDTFTENIEDDLPLQDLDLEDIANEFVSAINDSSDPLESPSGMGADLSSEDDLASVSDLSEAMDSPPQPDIKPVENALESEESAPDASDDDVVDLSGLEADDEDAFDLGEFDPDNDDAVDLEGFEAESMAAQMITEPTDLHTDMSIPEMDPEADQGMEFESPSGFEEPAIITGDTPADMDFTEALEPETDQVTSLADDDASDGFSDVVHDPGTPLEDTIDKLFPQPEPEAAEDMQSPLSEIDPEQEPELPGDPDISLAQEPAAADPDAGAATDPVPEPPSDGGLELDLQDDLDSGKTIQVVHKTSEEKEFPPVEEPEDLSIEGIDAAEDISPQEPAVGAMGIELSGTEQLEEGQAMDETGFQVTYVGEDQDADIHRTGDPISIKVKEHGSENHANADDLLKVFDNQSGSLSLKEMESTIEQVVQNVLTDKVETLLTSAIEKAVTREIDRLKNVLLSDLKSDDEA